MRRGLTLNPTVLTLVRHGETTANVEGVWHGATDTPLSDVGRAQAGRVAAALADRLEPTALYSSDLCRARDTAVTIGEAIGLEVQVEPALREYGLGSWEGRTFRELQKLEHFFQRITMNPDFAPPGGESARQVTKRFVAALRAIAARHPGERVVLVTHGGVLSMGIGYLLWGESASWRHLTDNCSVTQLVLEPSPELLSFNERWGE